MKKPLLNAKQVAEQLGLSVDTVYRLVAQRELAVVRLTLGPGEQRETRGGLRFDPDDVEAFVKRHRIGAATESRQPAVARAALRDVMPAERRFS